MQPADTAVVERAVRSFAAAMIGLAAHELNNRLAVMRETVGLMDDLARAGKSGAAGTARAHSSLEDQIGRALNVTRTLSGLSGALGAVNGGVDVSARLMDLIGLSARWAGQRALRLDLEAAAALPRAEGDPALFLCLVYRLITGVGPTLAPGGRLLLRAARDGSGIRVSLQAEGERTGAVAAPAPGDDAIDRELARRLGGELLYEGGGAPTIRLATFHENH